MIERQDNLSRHVSVNFNTLSSRLDQVSKVVADLASEVQANAQNAPVPAPPRMFTQAGGLCTLAGRSRPEPLVEVVNVLEQQKGTRQ